MAQELIRTTLVAAVAALLLVGCDGIRQDDGSEPRAADPGAPVPPSSQSSPRASPSSAAGLPGDFVVSTNEPFWQARVEGREVVLDGPGVQGRRFAIDSREDAAGARVVQASDAGGRITVRLSPGPCQDSMSGAEFPFAGGLEIDGTGPADGCARPVDMPPPRPSGD